MGEEYTMNEYIGSSLEDAMTECGYKMMGASIDGNAAASNSAQAGSIPAPPANYDRYYAAGIVAMDTYANECMDAGKFPTQQGCLDAAAEAMAASFVRDKVQEAIGKLCETYIDDASGA